MKQKTALYISIGILLLVVVGGYFVAKSLVKPVAQPTDDDNSPQVELPAADPSILVDVKAKSDGKAVILTISKIPAGTSSIEYEFNYTTGSGRDTGALGKIDLNGKTEITKEILLGTCSKNNCTYDTGVTSVKLTLRFNSDKGATQLSKEFPL